MVAGRGGKGIACAGGQCLATFPVFAPVALAVAVLSSRKRFEAARVPRRCRLGRGVGRRRRAVVAFSWPNAWGVAPGAALVGSAVISGAVIVYKFQADALMRRRAVLSALLLLSACSSGKPGLEHTIPHDVKASYVVACKADTVTLRTQEETGFVTTNAYTDQTTPLHKVTATAGSYTITIADSRCGTVGHAVGQTPQDN